MVSPDEITLGVVQGPEISVKARYTAKVSGRPRIVKGLYSHLHR